MGNSIETYLVIAASALACGLIILMIRTPGFFKRFFASAATGFAVLAAIDLTSAATGIFIAVSGWTIAVAAFLGLPGVISLLLIKAIWHI